ncbi:MAG TPA: hypothetical protein VFZ83_02700 [Acidimicrobiia bacterium]|nr:hypothetical protein [Acidimicrobiia bacterium]
MRRTLGSVLLVASLLTACSADGDDSSGAPATSSTTAPGSSTTTTGAPATPSTPPTTSGGIEPVRRAAAACETLVGQDPARARVLTSAPSVAAAVVAELAAVGAAAAPWDTLPPDHFVAVCTFAATPTAAQPPATIACPDGAVVLDVATSAFYADESGRTSDASAVHEPDPCVEPTPLP